MSCGPNIVQIFHRSAYRVDRVLKGTKPVEMPIEQPTSFGLVINPKTAKALGLTIPPSLLGRVDEVTSVEPACPSWADHLDEMDYGVTV